jgi:hypothetical protein
MKVLAFVLCAGCVSEPARPACTAARALAELNDPDNDDQDPWLSPDRTELVFASKRPGLAPGEQLWHAVRATYDAPFGAPAQLAGDFVTAGDVRGATMSDDGLILYYAKEPATGGPPAIYAATRADRTSDHFDASRLLVDEGDHPSLTANGLVMYFAAGSPSHLFRTTRASLDAPFAPATRLDELVVDEELQPSISADDSTLVFAQADTGPTHIVRSRRGAAVFGPAVPVVETQLPDPAATVERPSLHRDGVTIVFSSDITGGSAAEDLFITCE